MPDMEQDREELHHRLTNKHKSHAAELAWQRHHASYMSGVRKRQRDDLNSIYTDDKEEKDEAMNINELNNKLSKHIQEAEEEQDNVFDLEYKTDLNTIAGGIAFGINKNNNTVSFTTSLNGKGEGSYMSTVKLDDSALQNLYNSIKTDIQAVCDNFDKEINQILAKNGLKSTK